MVPGAQIPDGHEVLLVLVTGIGVPGITREYPGSWQKGTSNPPGTLHKRVPAYPPENRNHYPTRISYSPGIEGTRGK